MVRLSFSHIHVNSYLLAASSSSPSTGTTSGADTATSEEASLNPPPKADPLAFSSISKRVNAVIQQVEPTAFGIFFHPLLVSTDLKSQIPKVAMRQLIMLTGSVIEVVKEHTQHWTESDDHKESFDQALLVKVFSKILWTNSVVLKECVIDNKSLPHGIVDIICGCKCLGTDTDDLPIKLGVVVDKDMLPEQIDNPQLVRELNPQIVVEGLSFGEVISNPNNEPYIFLGASREAFRVFIRLGGKDDIILTTSGAIKWWSEDKPIIDGICALIFVVLCAGRMDEFPVLSAQNIELMAKDKKYETTGWTNFYEHCGRHYGDFIFPSGLTAKIENTRKRQDAVNSVLADAFMKDLQKVSRQ